MQTNALITMLVVQITVTFFTIRFFYTILKKPDVKGDSYVEDEIKNDD